MKVGSLSYKSWAVRLLGFHSLQLDPSSYEVSYANNSLHLTPREYSLLELLLRNGRRVLSRRAIIGHIWPLEAPPEEDTVKVHIRSLRQKLKATDAPEDFIETFHSIGYRLNKEYD